MRNNNSFFKTNNDNDTDSSEASRKFNQPSKASAESSQNKQPNPTKLAHGTQAAGNHDQVANLEKHQITDLARNVMKLSKSFQESPEKTQTKIDIAVVKANFGSLLATVKAFYDPAADNSDRLNDADMAKASNKINENKFAEGLVILLTARDDLYGIGL